MDIYGIKIDHDLYRGKDTIRNFCESLREQAKKINNSEKTKMTTLRNEQHQLYENLKICLNFEHK